MKIFRGLAAVIFLLWTTYAVYGQATIPVTGLRLKDNNLKPLSGQLVFTITDTSDKPIPYTELGKFQSTAPFVIQIVAGVVRDSDHFPARIANPATTVPANTRYRIQVQSTGGTTTYFTFPLVNITQKSFSFDTYRVPAGVTASGRGLPHIPCSPEAEYNNTLTNDPYPWVCSQSQRDSSVYWTQNPSRNSACSRNDQAIVSTLTGRTYCIPSTQAYVTPGFVWAGPPVGGMPSQVGLVPITQLCSGGACGVGEAAPGGTPGDHQFNNGGTGFGGDSRTNDDGAGNLTQVSTAPFNPFQPLLFKVASLHQSRNYQMTDASGLNGTGNAIPFLSEYTQSVRNAGGNFVNPWSRNVEIQGGYLNLGGGHNIGGNLAAEFQSDNLSWISRASGQAGGVHAENIYCWGIGDCVSHANLMYATGASRGTDESFEPGIGRNFYGWGNSNWGGHLTLGPANAVGDQTQTLTSFGGYSRYNKAEYALLMDVTRKTAATFNLVNSEPSKDGQFFLLNFPAGHGLGVSTFTTTTSAIDNGVYSGTCPNLVNTGTTYPAIGSNVNAQDAFATPENGIGEPQINGNFVNAPNGPMVGYCISVASSTGFKPGDKIAIYDSQLDPEYDTIIAVPDSKHITAYIHAPHNAGAVIAKGGGAGWGVGMVADIAAPGTLSTEQNAQNVASPVVYPIAYSTDSTHVAIFTNSDILNEFKTQGFTNTVPASPITISATASEGKVTGITFTPGNYSVLHNTGGQGILPPPTLTITGCTTSPQIKLTLGLNTNVPSYIPTLVNGGDGCVNPVTVKVNNLTNNFAYFAPVTWSYKVVNPDNCSTVYPFKCSAVDDYVLTFPWLQTVHNGDEIAQTRWWQRYGGGDFEIYNGDPITAFTGRTGITLKSYTFSNLPNGEGYFGIVDSTSSSRYIGRYPDWQPTIANPEDGQVLPGAAFTFTGGTNRFVWFLPPHGNSAAAGPAPTQAGVPPLGAPAFLFLCNANPAGTTAHLDDPCMHGQDYPFPIFTVGYGNAGNRSLWIDPNNGEMQYNGLFRSGQISLFEDNPGAFFQLGNNGGDGNVRWITNANANQFAIFNQGNGIYYGIAPFLPSSGFTNAFSGMTGWFGGIDIYGSATTGTATALFGVNAKDQTLNGPRGIGGNMFWVNADKSVGTFNNSIDKGNGDAEIAGNVLINSLAPRSSVCTDANKNLTTTGCAVGSSRLIRSLSWVYGNLATGPKLTTSEIGYITVPFACTIVGWHIMADAGTATIRTARVNGGENLPTLTANAISTSGVSLSRGNKIDSSSVTDFKSKAIVPNDTLGFFLTEVAKAKQITFSIDCAE